MGKKFHDVNINLDKLLRKDNGFIDWIGSIGLVLDYDVEGTEYSGTIKLLHAISPNKIVVQIDNEEPITVVRDILLRTHLKSYMGIKTRVFKYNIGDIISTTKKSIIVLEKKLIDEQVGYLVKCLSDNYEYDITESNLKEALKRYHTRCPVCSHHIIIDGLNSLYDEDPSLAEWFIDKDIPHRISRYSNQKQDLACPICKTPICIAPQNVKISPTCPQCGDGVSYPEKMFSNLLCQLKVPYIYQLSKKHFDWCGKYKYDFYFEHTNQKYIFELDGGLGHGKKELKKLDNSLERDNIKDKLAKEQGIILIRIDVNYDNIKDRFDYIKTNICNSSLSDLFDLRNIDWDEIMKSSSGSYLKICCDEYNQGNTYIRGIADKYNISVGTVRRYLKTGAKLGLCSYDPSNGFKDYMKNHFKGNNHEKYLKITHDNKVIICKGVSNAPNRIKDVFGISISLKQIYRHLRVPSTKSRKGLSFSYATEEEYLSYLRDCNNSEVLNL